MREVESQRELSHDVEECNQGLAQTRCEVVEGVAIELATTSRDARDVLGVEVPGREMQQVVHDECKQHHAAVAHGAHRVATTQPLMRLVAHGARRARAHHQLVGRPDVREDQAEQSNTRGPDQGTAALQGFRVGIEGLSTEEHLEVAQQVSDDKAEQGQPADRHDDL